MRALALAGAVILAAAGAASAQDYPARVVKASADPPVVAAGHVVEVRVDVEVDAGWHTYGLAPMEISLPTEFAAPKEGWPAGFTPLAPMESPAAEVKKTDLETQYLHAGKVSFRLPFLVAKDAAPGKREVAGALRLMACDEKGSCLPPESLPFTATLHVTEPSAVQVARAEFQARAAAGSTASLEIELGLAKSWHVYAQSLPDHKPPKFEWTLPPGISVDGGPTDASPPHEIDFFGEKLLVHEEKALLRQEFAVAADVRPGAYEVKGLGSWQRCNDSGCVDDEGVPVTATLVVGEGGAAAPAGDPGQAAKPVEPAAEPAEPAPASPEGGERKSKSGVPQGLAGTLLSGMGWGLLTILTPCVFPLLPVTVSFFSKQSGPALPRSTVYAAGIVFTLTVIGLLFKGSLDLMARGTAFNLFVGVLFIVLALSLFGLFELRLPGFLIDRSQAKTASGGLLGVFFMAVTLALTSFSCSVPFLAIMFSRFDQGDVAGSVAGLLAYSVTVALPFFLCSLFPSLLRTLPKSGSWMNAIKVTMGFVELALAFKFLRTVALNEGSAMLSDTFVLAIWIACALGAALYLFGYVTLPHDTKVESIGVIRLLFALLFLAIAFYLIPGTFGRPLHPDINGFLQRDLGAVALAPGGMQAEPAHIAWPRNDWDGALKRAAEKKRPALFDFTGVG